MSDADSARPIALAAAGTGPASAPRGGRSPARAARSSLLGGEQRLVERRRSGGSRARSGVVAASRRSVDVRERLLQALALRALQQRRELEQLQVAHDAVGDVEIGVQPQLARAGRRCARRCRAPPRAASAACPAGARPTARRIRRRRLLSRAPTAARRDGPHSAATPSASAHASASAAGRPPRRLGGERVLRGYRRSARIRLGRVSPRARGTTRRGGGRARACRARLLRTNSTASSRSCSRLARCSAASSGASSGRPRMPRRSIRRARKRPGASASSSARGAAVQLDEALDAFARLGRDLRRLGRRAEPAARGRACAAGRPGSRARGRPGAARSAGAPARARPRRRPAGRRAGAATRARRGPRARFRNARPCFLARPGGPAAARPRFSSRTQPKDTRARRIEPGYALGVDLIDWGAAQRIGELMAGSPAAGRRARRRGRAARAGLRAARERLQRACGCPRSCRRWRSWTGPAWIAANLQTMRPMLAPLAERVGEERRPARGPAAQPPRG